MKRKRKSFCPPLLDESPKRTKVQAQRKFAQGSNVNSPVITPIKELEAEIPRIDTLPEPVELLPIKRPNTEDFLTFLCFRGTPILPPSLNFFNTASIVDTNGQVHEIKSEASIKNGPIDIGKCGSSSEKPFIAFGVRKRADPIVISRQMDRKRRHALAIQALRRKYQEQKMAKIRAVAISKLSEKVTNKTLVKTNTVSKTETVTKKNNTLQKIKVVATKHVKVTTQTQRTTVRPKMKQKMCLRSFRGRFVQKELPFRKRIVSDKKIINRTIGNVRKKTELPPKRIGKISSEDPSSSKTQKISPRYVKKPPEITAKVITSKSPRVTRSGIIRNNLSERQKQKRILISNPKTLVKPRILRTTTMKKTVMSRRKSLKAQQRVQPRLKEKNLQTITPKDSEKPIEMKFEAPKTNPSTKREEKISEQKTSNKTETRKNSTNPIELKKVFKKVTDLKKQSSSVIEKNRGKKQVNKSLDIKKEISKSTNIKKNISKTVQIKRSTRISNVVEKVNLRKHRIRPTEIRRATRKINVKNINTGQSLVEESTKDSESALKNDGKPATRSQETKKPSDKESNALCKTGTIVGLDNPNMSKAKNKITKLERKVESIKPSEKLLEKPKKEYVIEQEIVKEEDKTEKVKEPSKKQMDLPKSEDIIKSETNVPVKKKSLGPVKLKKDSEKSEEIEKEKKKEVISRTKSVKLKQNISPKMFQRPTRKTKEAATIYMEILSHKLVNDGKIDDDNVSIDSFPELPNVKKTEQRENELKAKAKTKEDCKETGSVELLNDNDKTDPGIITKKNKPKDNPEKNIMSPKNSPIHIPCNIEENISIEELPVKEIEVPAVMSNITKDTILKSPHEKESNTPAENVKSISITITEVIHTITKSSDDKICKNVLSTLEPIVCDIEQQSNDTTLKDITEKQIEENGTITEKIVVNNICSKKKSELNTEVDNSMKEKCTEKVKIEKVLTPKEQKQHSMKEKCTEKVKIEKVVPKEQKQNSMKEKCTEKVKIEKVLTPKEQKQNSMKEKCTEKVKIEKVVVPKEQKQNSMKEKCTEKVKIEKVVTPKEQKQNSMKEKCTEKMRIEKVVTPKEQKQNSMKENCTEKVKIEKVVTPKEQKQLINEEIEMIKVDNDINGAESENEIIFKNYSQLIIKSDILTVIEDTQNLKKVTEVHEQDESKTSEEKHQLIENKTEITGTVSTDKEDTPKKKSFTAIKTYSVTKSQEKNESITETKIANIESKQLTNEEEKSMKNNPEIPDIGEKRKTRSIGSHLTQNECSNDSDQSFHVDVKVPRKKKITRSKSTTKICKPEEKHEEILKKEISSDSDESTSDINLQILANRQKNKKFTKKRPIKNVENNFCDSDEEPLSKLTIKSTHAEPVTETIKVKPKLINKKDNKAENKLNTADDASITKKNEPELSLKETTKPKRECAKRPQNYLPMLSSSDDEDIFHGFDEKAANKNTKTAPNPTCSHAPPLLDFLSKDIGRRWGKEKVNMSNEQIEKWLKESALASSSIKKENDEMLKFGERIPTETIEIDKKLTLFPVDSETVNKETVSKLVHTSEKIDNKELLKQHIDSVKPIDRKLIFRKGKADSAPNINAFSPENESSVYAFGEDNEEVISTPFRRPSRRPSSTATSRSEDESLKHEDSLKSGHFRKPTLKQEITKSQSKEELDTTIDAEDTTAHFYIPQKPTKSNNTKQCQVGSKSKLLDHKLTLKTSKSSEKIFDPEDYKYKVPSSPSASSSSSTKLYKRQPQKQKSRTQETVSSVYLSDFPKKSDPAKLVEAPTFHPTEQEFQDPLEYIERIRHKAEQFGICRIVPPGSFKPECKVADDMRFTAYNQYVHKMLHRWGPNFKELMAIKKYLETQNISITHPPWIGGMEIDLPRLYQTVQDLGGLKEVIEKKKWQRVSELMKIPKSAQDRVTKLDDIYCKYLLPYDTLSPAEREKLFDEVETEWAKRESKNLVKAQSKGDSDTNVELDTESEPEDNEAEECTTKGRNMALNAFYRIARNTMSMYFKNSEPSAQEVEERYWNYVMSRRNHICVHSGSIDSGSWGYGFAVAKNSPFARHPWNLKVLTNNSGSFLKSLGPVMGVTVPTLHVGMVFSSCCWYRDPHGLPWIEYLHTGASKIWYGIPNSTSDIFHTTLQKIVPNYCRNKELWLPSDTVMVPPSLLVANNVSLCRTVQDPGQFIVVFSKVFTSSISTGYMVSESVYFAPSYWLKMAKGLFEALRNSNEPSMFSLDRLLVRIAQDVKCGLEILRQTVPYVEELCLKEKEGRNKVRILGKIEEEKLPEPEGNKTKKKKMQQGEEGDYECEICRTSLFVSMLFDAQEGITYCLEHGLQAIEKKKAQLDKCKLMFTYNEEELDGLLEKIKMNIENRLHKKSCK